MARDRSLSFKAKGLYSLIQSYITYEEKGLTKSFLMSVCKEGDKAFESTWKELKNAGYLKVYLQPVGRSWHTEYELLDEPKPGPHTFYLNKQGVVTRTNLSPKKSEKQPSDDHIPQNGGNAPETIDHTPQKGTNAKGCNGKGGDNIILINKTNCNTISNPSICLYTREEIEGLTELERSDFDNEFEANAYGLFLDALTEMVSATSVKSYLGSNVTAEDVQKRIQDCRNQDPDHGMHNFAHQTVKNFIHGITRSEVKHHKAYMKSCIWDSFSTHQTKFAGLFLRTYDGAI